MHRPLRLPFAERFETTREIADLVLRDVSRRVRRLRADLRRRVAPPRAALARAVVSPERPLRVLLWATTLQGESLAVAWHLSRRTDCELLVVAKRPERVRTEPIAALGGFAAELVDRDAPDCDARARSFAADVVLFDNHVPPRRYAPRMVSLWHGLGWKARPRADLRTYYREVARVIDDDPRDPSSRFLAQCYGRRDRDWRTDAWDLDPASCRIVGMPMSDLLLAPPYRREDLAPWYPELEIGGRTTVLISLTWHFGRIFPGSWSGPGDVTPMAPDVALLRSLVDTALEHDGQVLLCLHDRARYEPSFLAAIEAAMRGLPRVHVKHKDERPDNLADLLLADVMVTNLSSFAAYHYVSGRPSVHLVPRDDAAVTFARMRRGRLESRRDDVDWMNAPTDTGGLVARDEPEAIAALRTAMTDPECCRRRAALWLERRVHGLDGATCERLFGVLREFALGDAA